MGIKYEAGTVTIAGYNAATGELESTVTFDKQFNKAPIVVVTLAEDLGTGKDIQPYVITITQKNFVLGTRTTVNPGIDELTWNYIAMERNSTEKSAQ